MWLGVWFINRGVIKWGAACGCGNMVPEAISKKLRPMHVAWLEEIQLSWDSLPLLSSSYTTDLVQSAIFDHYTW